MTAKNKKARTRTCRAIFCFLIYVRAIGIVTGVESHFTTTQNNLVGLGYPKWKENGISVGKDQEYIVKLSSGNKPLLLLNTVEALTWKTTKKVYYKVFDGATFDVPISELQLKGKVNEICTFFEDLRSRLALLKIDIPVGCEVIPEVKRFNAEQLNSPKVFEEEKGTVSYNINIDVKEFEFPTTVPGLSGTIGITLGGGIEFIYDKRLGIFPPDKYKGFQLTGSVEACIKYGYDWGDFTLLEASLCGNVPVVFTAENSTNPNCLLWGRLYMNDITGQGKVETLWGSVESRQVVIFPGQEFVNRCLLSK